MALLAGAAQWAGDLHERRRGLAPPRNRTERAARVACAVTLASVAFAAGLIYAGVAAVSGLPTATVDTGEVGLRGTVIEAPRVVALRSGDAAMVDMALTQWRPQDSGAWEAVQGRVTVVLEPDVVERDEVIEVAADLVASDQGAIAWSATLEAVGEPRGALAAGRTWIAEATAALPPERGGLVRGMLTGDTSAMSDAQVAAMRTSGLAHLTAVSGAHFAVVTLLVIAAARAVRAPRVVAAVAVAGAAVVFAAFVGAAPSVARATVMAAVVAAALALGRKARGLPALSTAVLAVVATAPALTVEIGFLMSVIAVSAIVLWAPVLARLMGRRMTPRAARAVSVPLAAQAALTPILLMLQPGISGWAIPANLVVVPFLLPLMMAGLTAACVGPWWPSAGHALLAVSDAAAIPVAAVAQAVTRVPGAMLAWPEGPRGLALASAVVLVAILATVAPTRRRRRATAALAVAVAASALAVSAWPGRVVDDWDVVMCDVGQGDMTLMRAGPHSAVVIDTGRDAALADACLRRYGVRHAPLLILTHPHADHDGAVTAVAARATVDRAWISRAGWNGRAHRDLAQAGVAVEVPALAQAVSAGSAAVRVLSFGHLDREPDDANDASIVVLVDGERARMLALGDLEPGAQRTLADVLPPLSVDVVKVAHHGSAAQDEALAADLTATVGMIGAGRDNDYGHPARAALDLYEDRVGTLAVTATCGDIVVSISAAGDAAVRCRSGMAP